MPITDGWLVYEAQAPFKIVAKHIGTILFLLVKFINRCETVVLSRV
jgi:hypothetical protein